MRHPFMSSISGYVIDESPLITKWKIRFTRTEESTKSFRAKEESLVESPFLLQIASSSIYGRSLGFDRLWSILVHL